MTSASRSPRLRLSSSTSRVPRPLPVWLQVGVVAQVSSVIKKALKLLIGLRLLVLTLWLPNLAAYNVWAAGGPPEPEAYKKVYAERSNMFFGWTWASFTALAAFTIWNLVAFIRHRRKQSSG